MKTKTINFAGCEVKRICFSAEEYSSLMADLRLLRHLLLKNNVGKEYYINILSQVLGVFARQAQNGVSKDSVDDFLEILENPSKFLGVNLDLRNNGCRMKLLERVATWKKMF